MLMPPDPIDTCVYATERRTDSCYETERSPPWTRTRPLLSATPANTGVVHEEADSGMPRVLIRCTVRVRSNLSGVYHRRASSHEGARRRGRMNVEQRRRGKKSLYRATGLVDQPREPASRGKIARSASFASTARGVYMCVASTRFTNDRISIFSSMEGFYVLAFRFPALRVNLGYLTLNVNQHLVKSSVLETFD